MGIGIGVIEQVHGVSWHSLPTEHLDEAIAFYGYDALFLCDPADGVVQQAQQVAMTREPVCTLDISGEISDTAGAQFAQYHSRLTCVRDLRVGQFGRIAHEPRDNREQGTLRGPERDAILRTGQPV